MAANEHYIVQEINYREGRDCKTIYVSIPWSDNTGTIAEKIDKSNYDTKPLFSYEDEPNKAIEFFNDFTDVVALMTDCKIWRFYIGGMSCYEASKLKVPCDKLVDEKLCAQFQRKRNEHSVSEKTQKTTVPITTFEDAIDLVLRQPLTRIRGGIFGANIPRASTFALADMLSISPAEDLIEVSRQYQRNGYCRTLAENNIDIPEFSALKTFNDKVTAKKVKFIGTYLEHVAGHSSYKKGAAPRS